MSIIDISKLDTDVETIVEHIESKLQIHKLNLNSKVSNKAMQQYNQTAIDVLKNLLLDIQELT